MRRKTLWISSLVVCVAAMVSWKASAKTPPLIPGDGDRFVVTNTAPGVALPDERLPDDFEVFPVEADQMYTVSNAGNGVAGAAEKLIYDNPLGKFAITFQGGQLVADDLTFSVKDGCPLTRYRFKIIGKANAAACGGEGMTCGPLRVDFGLFTECPGAGGVPIPGTEGCASTQPGDGCIFLPDADAMTQIDFVPNIPVVLPSAAWLGVTMSRTNAGVIVGAPALKGFSADVLDTIGFTCNSTVGGFPASPHSSFNASVYGDATCAETFLTYQNISAGEGGITPGTSTCIGEDIKLNRTCNMSQIEIAVRGLGRYDFELRRTTASGEPEGNCNAIAAFGQASAIPGTRFAFTNQGSGLKVFRKNFDTPIPLPVVNLQAVFMGNNVNAKWVLTRKDAVIGSTEATFFVFEGGPTGGTWNLTEASNIVQAIGSVTAGFHLTITCDGEAPVGACCDQFIRDAAGEAVCRDVPEINCAFPPKGTDLRPAWKEGVSCRVCSGGLRNGFGCSINDDCLDTVCVGGTNADLVCSVPADCPNGTCESGVCVDNDPFILPCGDSACCQPSGDCNNATLNECNLILPLDAPRIYDLGQLCASQNQRCPIPACIRAGGDCLVPHPSTCNGGADDGIECSGSDANCPGVVPGQPNDGTCATLAVSRCVGGDNNDMDCANDFDCIPGGSCATKLCLGGARAGQRCEFERDCKEAFCERFVGCSDPFCCTDVCNSAPGGPFGSEFCCQVEWDQPCANIAQIVCVDLPPSNDKCAPGTLETGEAGATKIKVNGPAVSTDGMNATDIPADPICCNGGQRRCVGGCNDDVVCENDFDCQGADPGFCNLFLGSANAACVGGCNSGSVCVDAGAAQPEVLCMGGINNGLPCAPRCTDGARADSPCAESTDCRFDGTCTNSVCVGGANDTQACVTSVDCQGFAVCDFGVDCPGGTCDNSFCDGIADGFCGDAVPRPGISGVGSVWYFFTVPDGVGDTLDVEVSTCGSSTPAKDSMVQVYAVGDNDSGLCSDTGTCVGDGSICSTLTRICADGTNCNPVDVPCSLAAQDCLAGSECVLNKVEACDSLNLIGCNDDAADGCGDSTQAQNSKLCLPNLRRGDTYYILVSAKSEATRGKYRVTVRSTSSCSGEDIGSCVADLCVGGAFDGDACITDAECAVAVIPGNDSCAFAEDIVDLNGDNAVTQRFNVGGATHDCRAPSCLGNLRKDVWYRYVAPESGQLLASTCGGSNATTPDTELIIYDGCECGGGVFTEPVPGAELCCSAIGDPFNCLPGSECDIQVVAGNCYLLRLGDNSGSGAQGDMQITLIPDTSCPAGSVTWVDPLANTVDARYARDCTNGGAALGIDTFTVTGPAGADPINCWSMCEASDGGVGPNGIASVVEGAPGEYTVTLTRPITPGSCTTVTYDPAGTPQTAKFSFLPADVNGDGTSSPGDILELIDILNGVGLAVWGPYSTDTDVSSVTGAPDILAVIDLLNGAGCFNTWNGLTIEMGDTCAACPIATP